jgi:Ca-activated chloride channel family protein
LTLGLVLDASGSQRKFIKDQKKHIRRFWRDVLQPRDKAFIVSFANPIRLVSDLTSSLDQLQDALEEFQDSDRKKQRALFPELGPPEYREQGTAFYDALYLCSRDVMGKVDGRKALVVFSDGEDNASAHHLLDVIEAAQESDVPIYGMRYTELKEGRLTSRNKYGTSVMKRIALETGGREFDASEDRVEQSFKAISEELRSTYEIGYATTNSMKDGGFRKVQIRCKRDGYVVRSKTGYYARVQ